MAEKTSSPDDRCLPEAFPRPLATSDGGPTPSLLKRAYARFVKLRGCPKEIARGFAVGLFVGMSPTMGAQMFIAVPLAALFKSNKLAAAAGVWITNPLTAPFIYGLTYLVGARIIGVSGQIKAGLTDGPTFMEFIAKAPEIFWVMTVGGVVVGLPLALVGYYLSFSAITRYRAKIQQKVAAGREKLAQRRRRTNRKKSKGRRS
jgi:uncharacterized protein (DUF2062 family)